MQTLLGNKWYQLDASSVQELLDTNLERGLDHREVGTRLQRFGANSIPTANGDGPIKRFLLQFHQPLVYLLLASATVTFALNEMVDTVVILGVVLANAIIGFMQEDKAVKALAALAASMSSKARVFRDGQAQELPAGELVPGDVVLLQSGDKVPADLRLATCKNLQVDEASLTGESLPVHKAVEPLPEETTLADRTNMAFSSSLVTFGQARGIVVATGGATELGRISELIKSADVTDTPLTKKIVKISHLLLYVILGLGAMTFAVGLLRGESAADMFKATVALAVGAIPEGLPAAVTVILAIGVARLARRRAIIRKLPAVETLGCTTVICSDKTGTLTQNQMTVREIWAGGQEYRLSGTGYNSDGAIERNYESIDIEMHPALRECLTVGFLCNESRLKRDENDQPAVEGDPTEGALLVAAQKSDLDLEHVSEKLPRIDSVPFESERQFMATLHSNSKEASKDASPSQHEKGCTVFIKGAVERVLERCSNMLDEIGSPIPIDSELVLGEFESMASRGLRVLAFAAKNLSDHQAELKESQLESMTLLGLQAMIDPPRVEVAGAINVCRSAGIEVKMITGDHAVTARAIAGHVGIVDNATEENTDVLTGAQLEAIGDDQLPNVAERVSVFARVTPEQKLRLVKALQSRGHVVAMTGDGVNDAPALKQADIGVAMGITGTEVAKEAADMVLTDDNFATIKSAVQEGRGVFDNLTKFIVWTLPTNIGEGLVIFAAILLGVTLPILPVQILWINMTTAVLLGLMLAFEPKEPGIMKRLPRQPAKPILDGVLLLRLGLVSTMLLAGSFGLFKWALDSGESEAVARTIAVNVFVFVQLLYLFNCRSLLHSAFHVGFFSNMWVWAGALATVALQMLYTYTPFMNDLFQSAPIGWNHWKPILAVAVVAYLVIGAEKLVRRQFGDSGSKIKVSHSQSSRPRGQLQSVGDA